MWKFEYGVSTFYFIFYFFASLIGGLKVDLALYFLFLAGMSMKRYYQCQQ